MNDSRRARSSYAAALETLERIRADAPDDILMRRHLAMIYTGLGRESDALREARHAVEQAREKWGPVHIMTTECLWGLAGVYARFGEDERALDELEYLLSVPSLLSYGRLKYGLGLDSLRDHPRFQKLLAQAERELPPPPPS
jgi:tetratricopeptide (TPR) repeat protein